MSTSLLFVKLFFFRKKIYFLKIFWLWPKNFRSFWNKVSAELSKLHPTCPREVYGRNFSELLTFNLKLFFIHGQKKLNFRWKLLHSPSKLYLTCGRQQLEKKCDALLYRNITFFGVSVKVFPRGSSKLHFIYSQPTFEHLINIRWKICIWKFFGKWAKIFQTGGKKLGGIDRRACFMCEGSF